MTKPKWRVEAELLAGNTTKFAFHGERPLSYHEVISSLASDFEFRALFSQTLAASSYEAFFWEAPPVTLGTLSRPFECVVIEGLSLTRLLPDPTPFSSHFASHHDQPALAFKNLGGDALLIVPTPLVSINCYAHLASFLRSAPDTQVDSFWSLVGTSMKERVSNSPLWLSTAGMGVSWLHFRLDSRPKYYRHAPYKSPPW